MEFWNVSFFNMPFQIEINYRWDSFFIWSGKSFGIFVKISSTVSGRGSLYLLEKECHFNKLPWPLSMVFELLLRVSGKANVSWHKVKPVFQGWERKREESHDSVGTKNRVRKETFRTLCSGGRRNTRLQSESKPWKQEGKKSRPRIW